ncbi:hypothetical protein VKS41_009024 [Umbelopsis sp. WA50703]
MLIQKPVSRQEIQDWIDAKEQGIIIATSPSSQSEDDINSERLSPRIIEQIQRFITSFRRRPPKNLDAASTAVQSLLRDVEASLEKEVQTLDQHARAVKISLSPDDVEQKMEWIESYICRELYECSASGDEALHDEALESRIAALNLLDLDLAHLGVIVDEGEDTAEIDEAVKEAGQQLQKLESTHAARDKMNHLLRTHAIIAEALERFADSHKTRATVDEDANIVKEMKHAMSVMTDKIDDNEETKPQISEDKEMEYCQSEKALPVEEEDDENVQKTENDKENNDEENKLKPIEELLTVPKVSATIKQSEDSSNVDPPSSVELARTPSETPSSEINLQFPPSPLKRARRDDDQHIRSAGADVLLPMLIFTVMAVVTFLETTNLVGLGLSADRVLSDVGDLKSGSSTPSTTSRQKFRTPQVDQLAGGGRSIRWYWAILEGTRTYYKQPTSYAATSY